MERVISEEEREVLLNEKNVRNVIVEIFNDSMTNEIMMITRTSMAFMEVFRYLLDVLEMSMFVNKDGGMVNLNLMKRNGKVIQTFSDEHFMLCCIKMVDWAYEEDVLSGIKEEIKGEH